MLLLDFLNVVMKAQHLRELLLLFDLFNHLLSQTDILLLLGLWLRAALLFVS